MTRIAPFQQRTATSRLLLLAGIFGWLALQPSVSALMIKRSLIERVQEADYIVVGTVVSQESRWHERLALLYTEATIRVTEALKIPRGETSPSELVIRVPGGQKGNRLMRVSEMPTFHPAERTLVFLRKGRAGTCRVVSGTHGAFRLITDPTLGEDAVANEARAFLVDATAEQFEFSPLPQAKVPFSQFRTYLRNLIHETTS